MKPKEHDNWTAPDLRGSVAVVTGASRGAAVQCDHTKEGQVRALFERVGREQSRLDLLVNNAWGGYESPGIPVVPFWRTPLRLWDAMFVAGLKAHLMACYFAVPLMLPRRRGLIISTVAWDHNKYLNRPDHPNWGVGSFYDIAKHATVRMVYPLESSCDLTSSVSTRMVSVARAPGQRTHCPRSVRELGTKPAKTGRKSLPIAVDFTAVIV